MNTEEKKRREFLRRRRHYAFYFSQADFVRWIDIYDIPFINDDLEQLLRSYNY